MPAARRSWWKPRGATSARSAACPPMTSTPTRSSPRLTRPPPPEAHLTRCVFLFALALAPALALAQYPTRAIHLVVPYPPGGGTDTVARPLALKLTEQLKQPVIVDNRGGASEIIGTEVVAHASPDGYTVLMTTNAFAINVALQRTLPYRPAKDFAPVTRLIATPFMLAAHPGLKAANLHELVALAKAEPGSLNYASLGAGTPHHLAMEWLKQLAGVNIVAVPYKGV